jgi:hypothetical protein
MQRLMRHSDVRVTTRIYAHLVVEDLRAAVDAHTPLLPLPAAQLEQLATAAVADLPQYSPTPASRRPRRPRSSRATARRLTGKGGAPCWDRTSDPHRVKVVLYR